MAAFGNHVRVVEVPGYQIHRLLSWGSQGDVFLATDAQGERVALKIVTPERVEGEHQAIERLRREGRLLGAIDSPHVVGVRGFLETPAWSCLVLQFLEGQRLDTAVRERAGEVPEAAFDARAATVVLPRGAEPRVGGGPAAKEVAAVLQTEEHVRWSLEVGIQFVRGVSALHEINLVHRDLKPQNAMLVEGRVVLIDFGFARMDGMTTLTQSGAAIGTLAFMSPEQFRGGGATKQSDVYGIGASLYYCLTGQAPVDANPASIAAFGSRRFAPSVRHKNPAVPKNLDAVVLRALQPDPRDRYEDASKVLADLERCQRGEPVQLPFSLQRLWRQRRRQLAWLAAFLVVGLMTLWLVAGFNASTVAQQLLAEAGSGSDAVLRRWQGLDEDQRVDVTKELNERVGADLALAEKVARQLHLGLLRMDGRARHRGVLVPTNGEDAPRSPAASDFLSLEQPRSLLVRPGRAWFLLRSDNTTAWWTPGDPRVLQLLIDVPEPGPAPILERPLGLLPTEAEIVGSAKPVTFQPGEVRFLTFAGQIVEISCPDPLAVHAVEMDIATASFAAAWLRSYVNKQEAFDCWLAHPAEPPGEAKAFWTWVQEQSQQAQDHMPMKCTIWCAHRLVTLLGCRLPSVQDWQRVAFEGAKVLGDEEQRVIVDEVPVDSPPTWDRTASGVCYINSNVAEWTLGTARGGFVAVPMSGRIDSGQRAWLALTQYVVGRPIGYRAGLRLYRTIVAVK